MAIPSEISEPTAEPLLGRAGIRFLKPFAQRSTRRELLDDLDGDLPALERSMRELAALNRWLGGHRSVTRALVSVLSNLPLTRPLRIVDVGCGTGDGLRAMAELLRQLRVPAELLGVDANPRIVELARQDSAHYPEISYRTLDALGGALDRLKPDVIVAALFCHHLTTQQLHDWLDARSSSGCRAIIVSDLQRHWLPYYLFHGLCALWRTSFMTRHDGAISVQRGFTKSELRHLADHAASRYTLEWCWAFRYQLVLYP